MNNFKVGDKAVVIGTIKEAIGISEGYIGEVVTITENLQTMVNALSGRVADIYMTDLPSRINGRLLGFEPHNLKPYYDGNEKVTWDENIFKPKELIKCPSE